MDGKDRIQQHKKIRCRALLTALLVAVLVEIAANCAFFTSGGSKIIVPAMTEEETVRIRGIGQEVSSVQFVFPEGFTAPATVGITLYDEGNSAGQRLPERTVVPHIQRSLWMRLHPAGKVRDMEIRADSALGAVCPESVILNSRCPFSFSAFRFLAVFAVALAFFGRRGLRAWFGKKADSTKGRRMLTALFVLFHGTFFALLGRLAPRIGNGELPDFRLCVFAAALIAVPAALFLAERLKRTWFPSLSYGKQLLLACFTLLSCGLPYFLIVPDPHSLIHALMIAPLFAGCAFITGGMSGTKKERATALAAGIVFFLLAGGICAVSRLPAGFGIGTGPVLADRSAGRFLTGVFTYLFQLPAVTTVFPFLTDIGRTASYAGPLPWNAFTGGAFFVMPYLLGGFGIFVGKREKRDLPRLAAGILLILSALAAGVLCMWYGIDGGYANDLLWLPSLFALIGWMSVFTKLDDHMEEREDVRLFLIRAVFLCSVAASGLMVFRYGGEILRTQRAGVFYRIFYDLQFWL